MSVFRLQNNVPRVYVKESRDFQVLCRIFDALHGGVMYDITSMQSLISPLKIDDTLLRLYATKVGFFTNAELGDKVLRYIVAAFPYIIKNKGNKIGIEQAVAAILKAENIPEKFGVPITSIVEIDNTNYVITVYAPLAVINKKALKEVLKYIIPTGYDYKISNAYI